MSGLARSEFIRQHLSLVLEQDRPTSQGALRGVLASRYAGRPVRRRRNSLRLFRAIGAGQKKEDYSNPAISSGHWCWRWNATRQN